MKADIMLMFRKKETMNNMKHNGVKLMIKQYLIYTGT